jgi:hypothetical protein
MTYTNIDRFVDSETIVETDPVLIQYLGVDEDTLNNNALCTSMVNCHVAPAGRSLMREINAETVLVPHAGRQNRSLALDVMPKSAGRACFIKDHSITYTLQKNGSFYYGGL